MRAAGGAVTTRVDDPAGEHTVFQPARSTPRAAPPAPPSARRPDPGVADDDLPDAPPRARPRNAMVEAAAPLLALAAAVRAAGASDLPALHRRAVAAAARFDAALAAGGYDEETRRRARYAVFATIDDVAQNLPGSARDGAEWARRSLVVRGFGENVGGERFWQLLGEMLARPAEHLALIELYHACLAAGFEGRYRHADPGGRLRAAQHSAYAALGHVRALSELELVPAWRGRPVPRRQAGLRTRVTLVASLVAAALLLLVLGLRLILIQTGQPAMAAMLALNPATPLRLSRAAPALAAPADAQSRRVGGFLAPEIAARLVVVEQDPRSLRVRTTVGTLFRSGSDALVPGREALFARIAAAAQREPGAIRIEGHADSDPVASLTFPDNVALSRARAERVAALFRARLDDPERVSAAGLGAAQPVASNATAAGKALNRRVEIVIPRSE
ncbi:type IVB secretion system protein IcmH/DotU [Sphingomonas sp. BK235]|uniref:type IVB secretion system protein IcmH/DotU n=1 Tax=Sphingomonas sp. BK235 TaxID=2512131 RepID=UPI0010D85614|nr:type IVB secretion system protein IcmH/DotU [Sphingomonas sp. BK235]TCP33684.1 type VI secretion system protein ImpK [Sphingomonas sp. BK235]